jgi:hypothetical protein
MVFSVGATPRLYNEDSRPAELEEKGSLRSETVRYGDEFQGTRTRERLSWRGSAVYTKDRPVLSSERTPQKNKTVTVKE